MFVNSITLPPGVRWGLPDQHPMDTPILAQTFSNGGGPTGTYVTYLHIRNGTRVWINTVKIEDDDDLGEIKANVLAAAGDLETEVLKDRKAVQELENLYSRGEHL